MNCRSGGPRTATLQSQDKPGYRILHIFSILYLLSYKKGDLYDDSPDIARSSSSYMNLTYLLHPVTSADPYCKAAVHVRLQSI